MGSVKAGSPQAMGLSQDIVGVVGKALTELGFDLSTVDVAPKGDLVPGTAVDAMIDRAAAFLLDDALGTSLAARTPIGSLGSLDYALCTSATVGAALAIVVKYFHVVTVRARLELIDERPMARLLYYRIDPAINRHWAEFALAAITLRIQQTVELGTPLRLGRVAFTHAPPRDQSAQDEFFGTRVIYNAPRDELGFEPGLLDRPLATASQSLAELLEQKLSQRAPAATGGELLRIRSALGELLDGGHTDVAALAKRLATSPRTLQRTLSTQGTSHSALLDDVRRERAAALLDTGMKIADVAKRLGFADPSSFFRTYRRWTGTSPKAARKRGG